MMRQLFLVALLLAYSYSHDHGDHDHDHDHDGGVTASLDGNSLTITFYPEEEFDSVTIDVTANGIDYTDTADEHDHDGHTDYEKEFTVSGVDECDEVHVVITGHEGDEEHEEFNGDLEIAGGCPVTASLDGQTLTILFHSEEDFDSVTITVTANDIDYTDTADEHDHDGHKDYEKDFTISGVDECDEVHVVITGHGDEEHEEFNGDLIIAGADGC